MGKSCMLKQKKEKNLSVFNPDTVTTKTFFGFQSKGKNKLCFTFETFILFLAFSLRNKMLILGTHVERAWRESCHDDSRWGTAAVCPVRPWALPTPPKCREPPAAPVAACPRALVFWRSSRTGGLLAGGQPPGERESRWHFSPTLHSSCTLHSLSTEIPALTHLIHLGCHDLD